MCRFAESDEAAHRSNDDLVSANSVALHSPRDALVHDHFHIHAAILRSAIRTLVRRGGIRYAHRAWSHDVAERDTQLCSRNAMTASARSILNCWFIAALPDESAYPFTWIRYPFGRPPLQPVRQCGLIACRNGSSFHWRNRQLRYLGFIFRQFEKRLFWASMSADCLNILRIGSDACALAAPCCWFAATPALLSRCLVGSQQCGTG